MVGSDSGLDVNCKGTAMQWGCNGDCEIEKLDTGLVIVVEISEANDE